jgi:hypothetical protein
MIEPVLLTATRVSTFEGSDQLTGATGFFFERDARLFLVTSRHVMHEESSGHRPDRIEIELHVDPENLARSTGFSIPLYAEGRGLWRQAADTAGQIDVAVIEIDRAALPSSVVYRAFTPEDILRHYGQVEVGTPLLVVGFPLGFHDTLHHMPVVRHAVVASSFGLRFQGRGYFLTDARTHRGSSGSPVVMRDPEADKEGRKNRISWVLLGVHSGRLDMDNREDGVDEALGLNYAYYADVLMTLTQT